MELTLRWNYIFVAKLEAFMVQTNTLFKYTGTVQWNTKLCHLRKFSAWFRKTIPHHKTKNASKVVRRIKKLRSTIPECYLKLIHQDNDMYQCIFSIPKNYNCCIYNNPKPNGSPSNDSCYSLHTAERHMVHWIGPYEWPWRIGSNRAASCNIKRVASEVLGSCPCLHICWIGGAGKRIFIREEWDHQEPFSSSRNQQSFESDDGPNDFDVSEALKAINPGAETGTYFARCRTHMHPSWKAFR